MRPLLFALDPETSHSLTLRLLSTVSRSGWLTRMLARSWAQTVPRLPVTVMGLRFANPVALAAGFDKDARAVSALTQLGFGGLELGTVTPLPQYGNPKPRVFRIATHEAIVNRLGFNSVGVTQFLKNFSRHHSAAIIGINIGKNTHTPVNRAVDDYLVCLNAVYNVAHYVTINISSPNTEELRELQGRAHLNDLLATLKQEQKRLAAQHGRYVPLAIKIAPDLNASEISEVAETLVANAIDGVVATNTTIQRPGIEDSPQAQRAGGLSGPPLHPLSTAVIKQLYEVLQGDIPIIGVGGVNSPETAWQTLEAGAEMVQLYSGLIYQGPEVVAKIVSGLADRATASQSSTLCQALLQTRQKLQA